MIVIIEHKLIQCNRFGCNNLYVRNRFGERLKLSVIRCEEDILRQDCQDRERQRQRQRERQRQNSINTTSNSINKKPRYKEPSPYHTTPNATHQQKQHHHHPSLTTSIQSLPPLHPENSKICIIYLHGFGSHRLQGITILSALSKDWNLCCFDFSGSGKSEGEISTYGIKEYLDIQAVMDVLRERFGYKKFVLWGRSMGATASLLYTSSLTTKKQDILFQVLDSPFISFQKIARHHATTSYHLPQLFINFGLNILKEQYKNHDYNPFKIDLGEILHQCRIPALFVYCEKDTIIPSDNSIQIIEKFNQRVLYQRLIIQENHNTFRGVETLKKIMEIVKKYVVQNKIKEKIKYKRGIGEILSGSLTPTLNSNDEIKIKKLSGLNSHNYSRNKLSSQKQYKQITKYNNPEDSRQIFYGYFFKSCRNCSKVERE